MKDQFRRSKLERGSGSNRERNGTGGCALAWGGQVQVPG